MEQDSVKKICEVFPLNFPSNPLTQKMHVASFVLPKCIREGTVYKFLKIEQKGGNLHLLSIKNWPNRYMMMIRKVENNLKAKKKCPELEADKMVRKYTKEVHCVMCEKKFKHKGALKMHSKGHEILK